MTQHLVLCLTAQHNDGLLEWRATCSHHNQVNSATLYTTPKLFGMLYKIQDNLSVHFGNDVVCPKKLNKTKKQTNKTKHFFYSKTWHHVLTLPNCNPLAVDVRLVYHSSWRTAPCWEVQRGRFARMSALRNLSRKESRKVAAATFGPISE